MRTLIVGGTQYLWRVSHRHDPDGVCEEVVTVYRDGAKRAPLRVHFPETAEYGAGAVRQSGVVVDYRSPSWTANLNRPRSARVIVEAGLAAGWSPVEDPRPFVIENGFDWLRSRSAALADEPGAA